MFCGVLISSQRALKRGAVRSEASSTLLANICVKPSEQSQACLSYAMASKYLTLVNESQDGSQNIVRRMI